MWRQWDGKGSEIAALLDEKNSTKINLFSWTVCNGSSFHIYFKICTDDSIL